MNKIQVDDKIFELLIPYDQIKKRTRLIGIQLNVSYEHQYPVFLGVLNGCFMFMADLMKQIDIACEISFVKLQSYHGAQRGAIEQLIGLEIDLKDRHVVIIEDVVDSGHSLRKTLDLVEAEAPASVSVCTLLYKPNSVQYTFDQLAYVGFEIGDEFVVGYGLDYNLMGRTLPNIYKYIPST
jgi:hypoxanthine phosphoribosyltransferase